MGGVGEGVYYRSLEIIEYKFMNLWINIQYTHRLMAYTLQQTVENVCTFFFFF